MIENNVRSERMKRQISGLKLSMLTGISPSDISQIELGRRQCFPAWRKKISNVLNVPEKELFPECQ